MPSFSSYPPGVSGNEPEITGEWKIDSHNPFEADFDCFTIGGLKGWWLLDWRFDDYSYNTLMKDEETAKRIAKERNALIPNECQYKNGVCVICGEPDLDALNAYA